ncbi:MAG: hypothetical protein JSV62_11375 [Promethearchaeota archaeon]|nr:MAG: hypothetical protein JSV62_11375 [Candidatus Lokiarchaeota archaeon]
MVYEIEFNIIDARVNNYTTGPQIIPAVCNLTNEIIAIVWESYEQEGVGLEYGVYGTVIDTTTGYNITAEFHVNDYTTYSQRYASICALSSEVVAIAWSSWNQDGSSWGVYAKVFNVITRTSMTPEIAVNENTTGYQYNPSICALSNDKFAISWQSDQDDEVFDIYARVFNATTGAGITGEFLVNNFTIGTQHHPSICKLTQDSFAVSWESSHLDGDGFGVFGVVIDAATGNNITNQFQINDYTVNDQWFSSLCALDNEKIAVTWRSEGQDGNGTGVYATVIDTATGYNITAELQMNEETASSQSNPSICALSSDIFIVAWESINQDGDGWGVYIRAVNVTTGTWITSEYQVNNYTIGHQSYSAVSALSSKRFAVVWNSEGQDGDSYGIYFSTSTLGNSIPNGTPTTISGYELYMMICVIGLSVTVAFRKYRKFN